MLRKFLAVYRLLAVFPIVLLTVSLPLSGQEADKKPNIIVSSRGIATGNLGLTLNESNQSISDVLQRSGLNAVIIEEEVGRQKLLETSEWLDAYFLVEYLYAADSESFQIDLNAYSTWDGQQIATQSITGSVESRSDISWDSALDRIVRTIQAYLQFIEEEDLSTDQELAALSDREDEIAAAIAAVVTTSATIADSADEASGSPEERATDLEESSGDVLRMEIKPYFVDVSGSPYVAVGSTSDLFKIGFTTAVIGGYTLMLDECELDLGLMVEMTFFNAKGVLVSSENQFLSIGPDVGVAFGRDSRFRLLGGLSTGLTIAFIQVSNGNTSAIYAPFLSVRLGGRFHFNQWFSLALVNRFTVYFLPSSSVSGFQPALGAAFRF